MKKLVCMPTQLYDAPSGKVGKRFVGILSVELDGVCARRWNAERVIVFQSVILKCAQGVNNYTQIWKCILFWLNCVGRLISLWKTCKILLWDTSENLAGVKRRSNVIERAWTSSWKENGTNPSDSSVPGKRGEFYNHTNCLRIVWEWSTILLHRFWRGKIRPKQSPPVIC